MDMPNDSAILLSVVNMKLRDFYKDLDALCDDLEWSRSEIEEKLSKIAYKYDGERNQFV